MKMKQIDDDVYVSGQITPEDVVALKQFGIKTIICNRPDDEESNQPSFSEIKLAAEQVDITAFYIPVVPMGISEENLTAMQQAIDNTQKPLLAYCRSGMRSSTIYNKVKQS